ncbi:MAG TPA: 16S rRNA (cytidine(1402)-2'-O)-methyltransferase [Candidatus Eremiobacteraceae bacterium]|nr:16S rRNA (cytidine(1402)-2'-O)-methyltransferase [Candidatus Eremiobacteraceae bacterium]
MTGRLVLCPTPLGNLEDVTLRVLRCLRECDFIFAEDTRVSETLLRRYEIDKPIRSFHERQEGRRLKEAGQILKDGKTIAVVTDAGMPGISDPGVELVRIAREAGAAVEVLPGPSACLGAAVLSGFDVARFCFEGFPPRSPGARRSHVASFANGTSAVIWYEAPTRVRALLTDIANELPGRRVFVLREYTKRFEEHIEGDAATALRSLADEPRGEFVVVLDGARESKADAEVDERAAAAVEMLVEGGVRPRLAADAIAAATGSNRKRLYTHAHRVAGKALDARETN